MDASITSCVQSFYTKMYVLLRAVIIMKVFYLIYNFF